MIPPAFADSGSALMTIFSEEPSNFDLDPLPSFRTVEYFPGCLIHLIPALRKNEERCRKCDPYRTAQVVACPWRKPINLAAAGEQVFLASYQRQELPCKYTAQELVAETKGLKIPVVR